MKSHALTWCLLTVVWIAGVAGASQDAGTSEPATSEPGAVESESQAAPSVEDAAIKEAAIRVTRAANHIHVDHAPTLVGYFAIPMAPGIQASLAGDKDLGPFIASRHADDSTHLVVLVPPSPDAGPTFAVYFRGDAVVGQATIPTPADRRISVDAVDEAYRPSSGEAEVRYPEQLVYSAGMLTSDSGLPVLGLQLFDGRAAAVPSQ